MTINCNQLDDLLFDGSPLAMQTARAHAEGCAQCAAVLADWDEISAAAQSMRATWSNEMLWPRIERSLTKSAERGHGFRLWQFAAAIALTVALGASSWYALRLHNRDAAFDQDILRVTALDDVERAEREHEQAIARLERLAEARLERSASPLMVSYREKLMLLDDAIAECESGISVNRQNAHLRNQLLAIYTEKQHTLKDVLREETSNESTP
jgi:hypothetical protein